jgi:hypothetical protein
MNTALVAPSREYLGRVFYAPMGHKNEVCPSASEVFFESEVALRQVSFPVSQQANLPSLCTQCKTSHLRKQILPGISFPSFDFPSPA